MQFGGYRLFESYNLLTEKEAREFASGCDNECESCSAGGDECRSDLVLDQRRFGFLEASLMHSRLDSALDFMINLFAVEHAER